MTMAMPWPWVMVGALTLAALLFALQRLRAQPRVVRVATAALWAQALKAAPRRVLVERFDRRLVYLLLLAIALLLWFAAAQPELREADDGRFHVFYLEAAAPMQVGGAFADARGAMLADVAAVPRDERTVELGTAAPVPLLDRGEDIALLRGRLSRAAPVAAPSAFADWLAQVPARYAGRGPVTVHYYGYGPAVAPATGSPGVRLVVGYRMAPLATNRGIVALGASPATSGVGSDVLIRMIDTAGVAMGVGDLRFELDGQRFDPPTPRAGDTGAVMLRGIAANGGTLRVMLAEGDRFTADDSAAIVLPDRRPVRVAIAPGTPPAIRAVAELDPAVRLVAPGDAQVVVRRVGQALGGDLPAFEVSDVAGGTAAFSITDPDGDDVATLTRDLGQIGVTQADAAELAEGSGRAIGAVVATGPRRAVAMWAALFAPDAGFAASRAMPPLVSRTLRWLARPAPALSYAQAGAPLPSAAPGEGSGFDTPPIRDALNGAIVPGEAGERRVGGQRVVVSLDAPDLTRAVAGGSRQADDGAARHRIPDLLLAALLLAAGILLGLEWWLLSRRRIA